MACRGFVWSISAIVISLSLAAPALAENDVPAPLPIDMPAPERPAALLPLYVSFAGLQVADVATTFNNVNHGATELNPVMGGLVHSPPAFVATKAALATLSIYCTEKVWRKNRAAAIALMVGLNGLSATIVARNYATRSGR